MFPRHCRPVYAELPLGAIKPAGWLKAQLDTPGHGLSGHLDEFWPDIKDSAWIGGKAEGWERVPVLARRPRSRWPTCSTTRAQGQGQEVRRLHPRPSARPTAGSGPIGDTPEAQALRRLAALRLFKALTQYQEATGDPRVMPAMLKCVPEDRRGHRRKEPIYSWAQFRVADLAVSLYWLHDKTGDKRVLAPGRKSRQEPTTGAPHFENFKFREQVDEVRPRQPRRQHGHGPEVRRASATG